MSEKVISRIVYGGAAFSVTLCLGVYLGVNAPYDNPPTKAAPITTKKVVHAWAKSDSLAYAKDQVQAQADKEFACLANLWGKESAWEPTAYNSIKVMGKNAGGIPQLLGMSPLTPPTVQIDRGLHYISYRYTLACNAWKHWKSHGWY